ncbi:MAG: helix-turn-helix domain-containing protein [Holosporaceae bacterium]|jgi:transcriptional regulator with XRE-family HTH domain|nr:helix-turn-helix domain-containing protein [Holosporaceae bacterium]
MNYLASKTKAPRNELDSYIGGRVKSRRTFLGISQEKLGHCLGVTFQQIQKYEKGINRISASTLYGIANVLAVDFSYFTDGYCGAGSLNESGTPIYEVNDDKKKETSELLRTYYKVNDPAVRKKILELVKTISSISKNKTSPRSETELLQ